MCLGTMIWSLTHTESKPKASTCCASRRMFCMVAACPRLGRLKPNSIRPLLVARYGAVMVAVVADLPDQSKSGVGLVAPGKVGYTGRYVSMGTPHSSPFSILLGTQLAGEAFCSFPPGGGRLGWGGEKHGLGTPLAFTPTLALPRLRGRG